jgi:hypothetical protein
MSNNASNAEEIFVYTGEGGAAVPQNVVSVWLLTDVELCEGLVEIGEESFNWCYHSITKINIPISLRRINGWAFRNSLRCPIRLQNGIESIGADAFAACIFTNFRVPPLITVIPASMLSNCKSLFSLELSDIVMEIRALAFYSSCYCLRNVAFPANVVFGDAIFIRAGIQMDTDLYQLFGSNASIIWELQHRFDGIPIHRIVYYQSYNQRVLQNLLAAINMTSGQSQSYALSWIQRAINKIVLG